MGRLLGKLFGVKNLPGDAQAWYSIGIAAVEAGRLDEATYALIHSVELAPLQVDRALAAVDHLIHAGCRGEAETIYRHLLTADPNRLDVHKELIELLIEGGNHTAAREEADRALVIAPTDSGIRVLAAVAYEHLGMLGAAIEHLMTVVAQDPSQEEAHRRLGALFSRTGERRRAIQAWRQVVAQVPQDYESLMALGVALSHEGEHVEALQLLRHVSTHRPDASAAHANLGMALVAAGEFDEAVQACMLSLELDPDSAQAHCGLGLAYQSLGRWAEAAEAFRATERLAPHLPAGPLNLSLALTALGQREQARAALLRAAALAPDDEEIRITLEQFLSANPTSEISPGPVDSSIRATSRASSWSICSSSCACRARRDRWWCPRDRAAASSGSHTGRSPARLPPVASA